MPSPHGNYTKRCPAQITTQHPYLPFRYTRQCPNSLANCPHRCRESACALARVEGQGGERGKSHIQHHLSTVKKSRRVDWCRVRVKADGRSQREGVDGRGEGKGGGAGGTGKKGSSSIEPGQSAISSAEKDGGGEGPMVHRGGGAVQARVELFGDGDREYTWIRCRLEEEMVLSELPSR